MAKSSHFGHVIFQRAKDNETRKQKNLKSNKNSEKRQKLREDNKLQTCATETASKLMTRTANFSVTRRWIIKRVRSKSSASFDNRSRDAMFRSFDTRLWINTDLHLSRWVVPSPLQQLALSVHRLLVLSTSGPDRLYSGHRSGGIASYLWPLRCISLINDRQVTADGLDQV